MGNEYIEMLKKKFIREMEEFTPEELNEISMMLYEVAIHYEHNLDEDELFKKAFNYAEKFELMANGKINYYPETALTIKKANLYRKDI